MNAEDFLQRITEKNVPSTNKGTGRLFLLIKRSVDNAVAVSDVYVSDVLTKNIHREVKTYNHAEITALLINHARKCAPGEKRLIKYSSIYGILHKLNAVDWGKITLKTAVEVFKNKDCFLDLMLKNLIKNFEFATIRRANTRWRLRCHSGDQLGAR